MLSRTFFGTLLWLLLSVPASAQTLLPGKNTPVLRGQTQEIYFYPARGESGRSIRKVLFAPGDGGWRGFAVTIAQAMASWGYDVYGLDTRRYLESFTGKTSLKETDVMSDFRQIAGWITQGRDERVILVGWSEGAGLGLLGAAAEGNKRTFSGLMAIGLSDANVLAWRWKDDLTYITKQDPKEPKFQASQFLPHVAPLPLEFIYSSHDEYIPREEANRLFSVARNPKRFVVIEAQNHRFDGNQGDFFRALYEGLQWITQTSH
ncbi:MAG: hypothetical protein HY314_11905 [Acidobacteria bacterium]|nr:hypothetical protein [Acidobacteriota bacterium]